eukprot:CAMPEP_0202084782 /NCGR_PEP_ID=MMETSP0964-20121228/28721_1 /ASSEMBLY_ACC=CAM_ASM_000500 /TAXON_ID=4773 /ORGANISM="Schizochytrium aggregatum, Strain ATCC28209" /LENGTH=44 /DNA_ID= /DNA_START= /DNA_END= /DNA_ORIENTATION=
MGAATARIWSSRYWPMAVCGSESAHGSMSAAPITGAGSTCAAAM